MRWPVEDPGHAGSRSLRTPPVLFLCRCFFSFFPVHFRSPFADSTPRETMAPIEARGLIAVLVLLLSVLHASAWVTPGLARQSSFVSQVRDSAGRLFSQTNWSWCNYAQRACPAGMATSDLSVFLSRDKAGFCLVNTSRRVVVVAPLRCRHFAFCLV